MYRAGHKKSLLFVTVKIWTKEQYGEKHIPENTIGFFAFSKS